MRRKARLALLALPLLAAAAPNPLAFAHGNTILCTAPSGQDQCHLWLEPDARYILFGQANTIRAGRTTQSTSADTTTICLHPDTPGITRPTPLQITAPPDPPFPDDMCLALTPHAPGESWTQDSPVGPLHLTLLAGHR